MDRLVFGAKTPMVWTSRAVGMAPAGCAPFAAHFTHGQCSALADNSTEHPRQASGFARPRLRLVCTRRLGPAAVKRWRADLLFEQQGRFCARVARIRRSVGTAVSRRVAVSP